MKFRVYFLHGFLGSSSDFNKIIKELETSKYEVECICPSLFSHKTPELISPSRSLKEWVKNFNDIVREGFDPQVNNLLVGYSMGGRLSLHLLEDDESLWSRVFVLAGHPGFLSLEEKEQRLLWQAKWIEKLNVLDWEQFLVEWNSQSIFDNDVEKKFLKENQYSKKSLGDALTRWSVVEHFVSKNILEKPNVHWVIGNGDVKYSRLYKKMKLENPSFNYQVVKSGHRVFANTSEIYNLIEEEGLQAWV